MLLVLLPLVPNPILKYIHPKYLPLLAATISSIDMRYHASSRSFVRASVLVLVFIYTSFYTVFMPLDFIHSFYNSFIRYLFNKDFILVIYLYILYDVFILILGFN